MTEEKRKEQITELEQAIQQRGNVLVANDPVIQKWLGRLELLKEMNEEVTEE